MNLETAQPRLERLILLFEIGVERFLQLHFSPEFIPDMLYGASMHSGHPILSGSLFLMYEA